MHEMKTPTQLNAYMHVLLQMYMMLLPYFIHDTYRIANQLEDIELASYVHNNKYKV